MFNRWGNKNMKIKTPKISSKIIQHKTIIKPIEKPKITFRKTEFLGRVEI
jgi:hypothetical protein